MVDIRTVLMCSQMQNSPSQSCRYKVSYLLSCPTMPASTVGLGKDTIGKSWSNFALLFLKRYPDSRSLYLRHSLDSLWWLHWWPQLSLLQRIIFWSLSNLSKVKYTDGEISIEVKRDLNNIYNDFLSHLWYWLRKNSEDDNFLKRTRAQ